jgi:hypothetical protein
MVITTKKLRELKEFGTEQEGNFKLICGHNNGYKEPFYPLDWVCSECGRKTSNPVKVDETQIKEFESHERYEIISQASQVIKPTIWFTNSIFNNVDLATEEELKELKELTFKSLEIKKEVSKIDNRISDILSFIDKGRKENY